MTGARKAQQQLPSATTPHGDFAGQCELARLRRERDAAVAQGQDELRRARDTAVEETHQVRAQLERLQQDHAALREAHAVNLAKAEQQAERSARDLATAAREIECLQTAQVSLAAGGRRSQLRIDALETEQAVLLDCYQALEAERQQASQHGPAAPEREHTMQLSAEPGSPIVGHGASWDREDGDHELAIVPANISINKGTVAQRLALSSSHLTLALRCAELQHKLQQQRRQAASSSQAAAAAQEQVAGLRLLVARQQTAGGCTAQLQERLSAVYQQLEEARLLGGQLQQQLAQVQEKST
ncbi:hypothetical protein D9Q98_005467 [Chlorella vulgaris]|uniref:Uncharacterized protein n=1 Tax=Chlorella vulgaris TaxID=3077 RepID=A0A9D4TM12_CHLVU|nr:hypothetical protein D9Q98_005467 [Chlorella vulgaris]